MLPILVLGIVGAVLFGWEKEKPATISIAAIDDEAKSVPVSDPVDPAIIVPIESGDSNAQ